MNKTIISYIIIIMISDHDDSDYHDDSDCHDEEDK